MSSIWEPDQDIAGHCHVIRSASDLTVTRVKSVTRIFVCIVNVVSVQLQNTLCHIRYKVYTTIRLNQ